MKTKQSNNKGDKMKRRRKAKKRSKRKLNIIKSHPKQMDIINPREHLLSSVPKKDSKPQPPPSIREILEEQTGSEAEQKTPKTSATPAQKDPEPRVTEECFDYNYKMPAFGQSFDQQLINKLRFTTREYIKHIANRDSKEVIDTLKDLINDRLLPWWGYKLHDRIQDSLTHLLTGTAFNPSLGGYRVSTSTDPYAAYDIMLENKAGVPKVLNIEIKTSVQTVACNPTFVTNLRKQVDKYYQQRLHGPTLLIQYQRIIEPCRQHDKTEVFYDLSKLDKDGYRREVVKWSDKSFWAAALIVPPVNTKSPGNTQCFNVWTCPLVRRSLEPYGLMGVIGSLHMKGVKSFLNEVETSWGLCKFNAFNLSGDSPFKVLCENLTTKHNLMKEALNKRSFSSNNLVKRLYEYEVGMKTRLEAS
tara:strand:- start:550 stop:1794 length:1245 start_codon:yes stop_codon:yes gene_type:complete